MTLILWVAALGLAAAMASALFVLTAPVGLRAQTAYHDAGISAWLEVRLGLGALILRRTADGLVELVILGRTLWSRPATTALGWLRRLGRTREQRVRWRKRGRGALGLVRDMIPRWRAVLGALRTLLGKFRFRLHVAGTIGFDDPADTVIFFELLRLVAPRLPGCELELERDYFDETLDLEVTMRIRVWPVHLASLALRALSRREVRQALRALR